MPTAGKRLRERRWIVLGTDGRYVTLGRDSDPSEDEIQRAEAGLRLHGLAGWLAVMEGNPFVDVVPRLLQVRPLAGPTVPFEEASARCVNAIRANRAAFSQ
jgi:hypothetical protein